MNKKVVLVFLLMILMFGASCTAMNNASKNVSNWNDASSGVKLTEKNMQIISPAFKNNEKIPAKYTCDGENINPPLQFSDVPDVARSLVLIVDDPDAPLGDWAHWLLWNISPNTINIEENIVTAGAVQGLNDFKENKYGGPCPPSGTHRYFFKLYALDILLDLPFCTKKDQLVKEMSNHILAQAELVGTYER